MWTTLRTPAWLARIVFVVGLITLLSAILPQLTSRIGDLTSIVPPVFPAAATTGASAAGLMLIVLSRALRRGKFRAWLYATVLTALAVVLHIVKGLDIEEAVLCLLLLVLLVTSRQSFTARPDPRSLGNLLAVIVVGPIAATVLGYLWLLVDSDGQAAGTTQLQRVGQAFLGLLGIDGPVRFVDHTDDVRASVALVVLGASVLIFALFTALQPADGPHALTDEERVPLGALVEKYGANDSLSYFSLRDDRSVIFAPNGRAAITYRVIGTVSMAAGDPVGAPDSWAAVIEAWLDEARSYGWVPAVLAASEKGAQEFHRAGLDALEFGDEAILQVCDFGLEGRSMRGVRQAVSRCCRAGLDVTVHRVSDLAEAELESIRTKAEQWRDGAVERGFSMALGRFGSPEDGRAVVALCRDADGELHGLLHFVPWGATGLSLDLMRRDRDSENGVIEQMVTAIMTAAPALGVREVSLNFAVFRSVFSRGERLGAGPVLRLWRSVLLYLSRFWQIESLYRANAKYRPEWVPRFLCFRSSTDLPRVGVAALRLEALIVAPQFLQRLARLL